MLTLNVVGWQSIALNILHNYTSKKSGFTQRDLFQIKNYFQKKIAKCRQKSNLQKYGTHFSTSYEIVKDAQATNTKKEKNPSCKCLIY